LIKKWHGTLSIVTRGAGKYLEHE